MDLGRVNIAPWDDVTVLFIGIDTGVSQFLLRRRSLSKWIIYDCAIVSGIDDASRQRRENADRHDIGRFFLSIRASQRPGRVRTVYIPNRGLYIYISSQIKCDGSGRKRIVGIMQRWLNSDIRGVDAKCRAPPNSVFKIRTRARFKCVEALGRIIIRGPYTPSNAIIYMHLQL